MTTSEDGICIPAENPETHLEITPKTIEEVIDDILQVWSKLP